MTQTGGAVCPGKRGQQRKRPVHRMSQNAPAVKSLRYTYTLCDLSVQWTSSSRLKSVNALGASLLSHAKTHAHTHLHIPSTNHFSLALSHSHSKLIPIVFAKQRMSQRLPHGVACYICVRVHVHVHVCAWAAH